MRHADLTDGTSTLRVVGAVAAGSSLDPALAAGECVRIMTGAPVPTDADTIVPIELTDGGHDSVTITGTVEPGQHLRGAGEDVRADDVVADAGVTVTARVLGTLAAAGTAAVQTMVSMPRRCSTRHAPSRGASTPTASIRIGPRRPLASSHRPASSRRRRTFASVIASNGCP